MASEHIADRQGVRKYVVYDPPVSGLPYIGVYFHADARPKVFIFHT